MSVNQNTANKSWLKIVSYTVLSALLIWVGFTFANKMFAVTDFFGELFSSTKEAAGELFSIGGERVINPTELHEYYTVVIGGEEVLGMGYGLFHATGFVFIDGPGLADNENVILRDAVYLGQTTVSSSGVKFSIIDGDLFVQLPKSKFFGTTLAVEPVIENNTELMAGLGQLFGNQTNTKPFRDELKAAVTERINENTDLFLMADCMAAITITNNVLPGFARSQNLELPETTVVNGNGETISSAICNSIDTSFTATNLSGLRMNLDDMGRISDSNLGNIQLDSG